MALPFFYKAEISPVLNSLDLDEATSSHVVQVLRMKTGDNLNVTDGKGNLYECEITDPNRKRCTVTILKKTFKEAPAIKTSLAVSLIKNTSRFEWFLEKATELGIPEIIPMICERTEKEKFRYERMQQICVSAMLQSQQVWLPVLSEPASFTVLIEKSDFELKLIAYCPDDHKKKSLSSYKIISSSIILIGPEGDFTPGEIKSALGKGFEPVSLGDNRLRTETAALVAAVYFSGL